MLVQPGSAGHVPGDGPAVRVARLSVVVLLPAIVLALAGCGGGKSSSSATATAPDTTAPATTGAASQQPIPAVRVTITSPTHRPKANQPWPVKVTVTDEQGHPLAGRLTMRVLFAGTEVGKIDDGAVYRFVGAWQERKGNEIVWPPASRGQPLTFQVAVTASGTTVEKGWWIKVR